MVDRAVAGAVASWLSGWGVAPMMSFCTEIKGRMAHRGYGYMVTSPAAGSRRLVLYPACA